MPLGHRLRTAQGLALICLSLSPLIAGAWRAGQPLFGG